jgi:hypothetical protein
MQGHERRHRAAEQDRTQADAERAHDAVSVSGVLDELRLIASVWRLPDDVLWRIDVARAKALELERNAKFSGRPRR